MIDRLHIHVRMTIFAVSCSDDLVLTEISTSQFLVLIAIFRHILIYDSNSRKDTSCAWTI